MNEFAIAIPQMAVGKRPDPAVLPPFLQAAEEFGFHSAWVLEHVALAPEVSAYTPVSLLSYASALTSRLQLGCGVFLSALYAPFQLARELATIDCLSGGRLIAGVGLGRKRYLYPAFGFSSDRHVHRFEEGLAVMRMLWSLPRISFKGEFWNLDDVGIDPRPIQDPLPLWFGAQRDAALKRAADMGQGWIGSGDSTPEEFGNAARLLRGYLREFGKDEDSFTMGRRVFISVNDDRTRAQSDMQDWFGRTYGAPERGGTAGIAGGPEECAERLASLRALGSQLTVLHPISDPMEQLQAIGEQVLPLLQEARG